MKYLIAFLAVTVTAVASLVAQPAFPTNVVIKLNHAGGVTVAWDRAAAHESTIVYSVLIGVRSGIYNVRQEVGTNLTATITNLPAGVTYFFAVVARNVQGVDSEPSNEVSQLIAKPVTTPGTRTVSVKAALMSSPYPDGPWSKVVKFPEYNFLARSDARFYRIESELSPGAFITQAK